MTRIFTGDYSTGDLGQWQYVFNVVVDGADTPDNYPGGYPLQIVPADGDCGYQARFECRAGDVPGGPGGERTEIGTDTPMDAVGTTRWYAFSIMFDPSVPNTGAGAGNGCTFNQWHDDLSGSSPTLSFATGGNANGVWSLWQSPQNAVGDYLTAVRVLDLPLNRGVWHDIVMQVHWAGTDVDGWVKVWHNGVTQTLLGGGTTFTGRTTLPTATSVHYHEGIYRDPTQSFGTWIVYHRGYRSADSAASL